MKRSILVIAGEISGDMHAAQVVRAIKAKAPDTEFWGIGGDELRAEGVELLHDVRDMAVMGFFEVIKGIGFFVRVFLQILREVKARKPDSVILVDYPGFNLRMAKQLKKRGIKVYYYVSPQVWAWKKERIPMMAKVIDRLMVIFPFEVGVFKDTPLQVDYVGHPLVGEINHFLSTDPVELPWQGERKVGLLPGSRHQEIGRILPVMLAAAQKLEAKHPNLSFMIPVPNEQVEADVRQRIAATQDKPVKVTVVRGQTREVVRQAEAALVTSGTATLETALIGCPMVVTYKTQAITAFLARQLVKIPYICIVNIVANRSVVPEVLQNDATPESLFEHIDHLLGDTPEHGKMVVGYEEIREILGTQDAGQTIADIVLGDLPI